MWSIRFSLVLKPSTLKKIARYGISFAAPLWVMFLALTIAYVVCVPSQDRVQGALAYILYTHVPASWCALSIYCAMGMFSGAGLVYKSPQFFLLARTLAPIGACMCSISLVTGSLWGKPTWGTFWVWDARLTSMFVLMMLYGSYLYLALGSRQQHLFSASMLALLGMVNLPIIHGSVEWWHTLHQPSSFRLLRMSTTMDPQFLYPLLLATLFYSCFCLHIFCLNIQRGLNHNGDH